MMKWTLPERAKVTPPGPNLFETLRQGKDMVYGPRKMKRQYGAINYLPIGPGLAPVYLIHEPEMVHQVLVKNQDGYQKDRYLKWMAPIFGEGILVTDGQVWQRARSMMVPAFHRRVLQGYAETMREITDRALDNLDTGRGFDVDMWTRDLALEIALACLFGSSLGDKAPRVAEGLDNLLDFGNSVLDGLFAPNMEKNTAGTRAFRHGMKLLDDVIHEILDERASSTEEHHDLLSLLLSARDEDGIGLDEDELHDQIITLLLAGHETTALALAYTLMLLGWNPKITQKAQDHLDEVLQGRDITAGDLRDIRYINRIIQEGLRLYPPAAITVREAIAEDEIAGYTIPVGAQVIVPIFSIHHDERWYPEPFKFDPDRWDNDAFRARPHYAFLPFGGGVRTCIAEQFARMEMQIVLSTILQRITPKTLVGTPPELEVTITMRPLSSIPMLFQERGRL